MKLFKKTALVLLFVFAVSAFCPYPVDARKKAKAKPAMTCKSAILSNSTKGKRLFGKDVERKVLPASTVKIMTALIVLERLPLDQYLTVGSAAMNVQPTKLNLVPGEQYRVADLLYAILLKSANDASVVLAEAVAGSEEKFVGMMNQRAMQLGARDTEFANCHGLPTSSKGRVQYTTAYDMYLIFVKALKHSFFREAIKRKYKTIYSRDGRAIALKSHNKILFSGWKKEIYGKTGYTRAAGTCFVGTLNDRGNTLVIGVFGCNDRWGYIKKIVSRYGGIEL